MVRSSRDDVVSTGRVIKVNTVPVGGFSILIKLAQLAPANQEIEWSDSGLSVCEDTHERSLALTQEKRARAAHRTLPIRRPDSP